jgi:hypothetical protein
VVAPSVLINDRIVVDSIKQVLNSTNCMLDIWDLVNRHNLVNTCMNRNHYSKTDRREG